MKESDKCRSKECRSATHKDRRTYAVGIDPEYKRVLIESDVP
jgi:hypothetical protein